MGKIPFDYNPIGIKAGGEIIDLTDYLSFTANADNSAIKLTKTGSPSAVLLEYSTDKQSWNDYTVDDVIELNEGDKVYFRGDNNAFYQDIQKYYSFAMSGSIAADGNVNTILDKTATISSLPNNSFFNLFLGCTSLTTPPKLPATGVSWQCYRSMFKGCSSLSAAPLLPATTLANYCYQDMFNGCTSLSSAPVLSATTLANNCYANMFNGCTSLTTPPVLSATTLAEKCYNSMFRYCSSLSAAPALPATTLANYCYQGMFDNCTALSAAPALPATTLAYACYAEMFNKCTSLTDAPKLNATTLSGSCYANMFYSCSLLSSIDVNFTSWNDVNATNYWVYNVANNGVFRCSKALSTEYGESRIPEGWIVEYNDDFLEFTAEEANSTLRIEKAYENSRYPAELEDLNCEYSTDKVNWQPYTLSTTLTLENVDDKIWMRGTGDSTAAKHSSQNYWTYHKFIMTGRISADGDMMMMVRNADGRKKRQAPTFCFMFNGCSALTHAPYCSADSLSDYSFYNLFRDCSSLSSASELPVTTLANSCYNKMFYGCSSLSSAPELPATTLADGCYSGMFWLCTSLTDAPVLSATTLADGCYGSMFRVCSSLSSAPELPATTLANNCYSGMFYGCSSLSSAPALPATTLTNNCYDSMFYGCSSLSSAPVLSATTLVPYCYSSMFYGCKSLSSAPALPATTAAQYCYQQMFYGCTSLSSAPELPATTLAPYCYFNMFCACTSLSSAPSALPATTATQFCYESMFKGCTSLRSAPELPATTLANNCYANMFTDCTSLSSAPSVLPATTAAQYCYNSMFFRCASLTDAPLIKATSTANRCCGTMYRGCTSLSSISVDFTTWGSSINLNNWVVDVAASGVFYCPSGLAEEYGSNRIPNGWTRIEYESLPFYIQATTNNTYGFLNYYGNLEGDGPYEVVDEEAWEEEQEPIYHEAVTHWDDELQEEVVDEEEWYEEQPPIIHEAVTHNEFYPIPPYNIEYSTDMVTWQSAEFYASAFDIQTGQGTYDGYSSTGSYNFTTINAGERLYLRGTNTTFNDDSDPNNPTHGIFDFSNAVISGGNIMSLLDPTMQQTTAPSGCFDTLFSQITFA